MKITIEGKRAIVTGASSGIGRATAIELARCGAKVVITARRRERLEKVSAKMSEAATQAGFDAHCVEIVVGDVTDPTHRTEALETICEKFGRLDILVNNAGVGATGLFEHANRERVRHVMEVNFFALVELTREALPLLKKSESPSIVNVSSILGYRGTPHACEYSASKYAVQGFSDALRVELHQHGIHVLTVCPGTTETEFFEVVVERTSEPNWPEHKPVSAEVVGRKIVAAIAKRKREITPYFWGKVMILINKISPSLMDRIMRKYV